MTLFVAEYGSRDAGSFLMVSAAEKVRRRGRCGCP